jgi:hypothetical protein
VESNALTTDQLNRRFRFHPPSDQITKDKHERVRAVCLIVAKELVETTGVPTREQSLAITKLEEVMFWANAAIARGS